MSVIFNNLIFLNNYYDFYTKHAFAKKQVAT